MLRAIHSDSFRMHIWTAPVRQGKTVGFCIGLIQTALYNYTNQIGNNVYILAGQTVGSIERNTKETFREITTLYGLKFKFVGGIERSYQIFSGKTLIATFYLFGGSKADSHVPVMGLTATNAFVDEATKLHEDFIPNVIQRCSFKESKIFIGSNADSPFHPFKIDYIDKPLERGEADLFYLDSMFRENNYLDTSVYDFLENYFESTNHVYLRNIKGQWVPAEGLVFAIQPQMVVNHKQLNIHDDSLINFGYNSRSDFINNQLSSLPFGLVGFDLGIEGTTVGT